MALSAFKWAPSRRVRVIRTHRHTHTQGTHTKGSLLPPFSMMNCYFGSTHAHPFAEEKKMRRREKGTEMS